MWDTRHQLILTEAFNILLPGLKIHTMSTTRVKLALIGTGTWGQNYLRTISQISKALLPSRYIKTHDYSDLFDQKDIDGVIIATPPQTHYKIAKDFLERDFNVFIEKPLTTNYQDALRLKEIVDRENGRIVAMVGHIYLYHPAFVAMQKFVKAIGKIHYIASQGMDYGPIRQDVSALWDWAPHDIAMCLSLLGKTPVSVSAWAINVLRPKRVLYDMCSLRLQFADNIQAFIDIGWLSTVKKRNMIVVGQKGALLFDDVAKRKLTHIESLGEENKISYPPCLPSSPLTLEVLEFIACIETGRKPKTDLNEGVLTIKIIEAAEKSIQRNGEAVVV